MAHPGGRGSKGSADFPETPGGARFCFGSEEAPLWLNIFLHFLYGPAQVNVCLYNIHAWILTLSITLLDFFGEREGPVLISAVWDRSVSLMCSRLGSDFFNGPVSIASAEPAPEESCYRGPAKVSF